MKIKVFLFGKYTDCSSNPEFEMDIESNSTIRDLANNLSIQETPDCWILLNGIRSNFDSALSEGDEVYFFQPVGGG